MLCLLKFHKEKLQSQLLGTYPNTCKWAFDDALPAYLQVKHSLWSLKVKMLVQIQIIESTQLYDNNKDNIMYIMVVILIVKLEYIIRSEAWKNLRRA